LRDSQLIKKAKKGRLVPINKMINGEELIVGYFSKNKTFFFDVPQKLTELDKKILIKKEYDTI